MDTFVTVKYLTKSLNKAFGVYMVIIFLSCMPTLGYGLSCIISNSPNQLVDNIRTIYILGAFYFFLLLAAKGHSDVSRTKYIL